KQAGACGIAVRKHASPPLCRARDLMSGACRGTQLWVTVDLGILRWDMARIFVEDDEFGGARHFGGGAHGVHDVAQLEEMPTFQLQDVLARLEERVRVAEELARRALHLDVRAEDVRYRKSVALHETREPCNAHAVGLEVLHEQQARVERVAGQQK